MKNFLLAVAVAAVACVRCFGDVTFELQFPEKDFKAKTKNSRMFKPVSFGPENFLPGPENSFAFRLSDKNIAENVFPTFSGNTSVSLPHGSFEVTCKVLKRLPDTSARIMHLYSPAQEPNNLLIYYCFIDRKGNLVFMIQVNDRKFKLAIPAEKFKESEFNTFKLTWNSRRMSCFLNGKRIQDCALPEDFSEIAARKRIWSSLQILPVFPKLGDSGKNRIAVSSMFFKDDNQERQ